MEADITVTLDLARALLRAQHPDLADLPLRIVANGWDNVVVRLGEKLALRLPRREVAAHLVEHEQAVLPLLAPLLPVAVPTPVRIGRPNEGYPYPWSVVPWFDGTEAAATSVARRTAWAAHLGRSLSALHVPAPADAPDNPYRGVPLSTRDAVFRERIGQVDPATARALVPAWDAGLATAPFTRPPVWLHGDPHPANIVVAPGGTSSGAASAGASAGTSTSAPSGAVDTLVALVDFGDVTSGDPASDLATAWLTFDVDGRAAFRSAYDAVRSPDAATWVRARAWAASFALVMLAFPDTHPLLAQVGRHTVDQLAAD